MRKRLADVSPPQERLQYTVIAARLRGLEFHVCQLRYRIHPNKWVDIRTPEGVAVPELAAAELPRPLQRISAHTLLRNPYSSASCTLESSYGYP